MRHMLKFGKQYVAYDGLVPADGYMFCTGQTLALVFPTLESAQEFTTTSGPQWAIDLAAAGHLTVVPADT